MVEGLNEEALRVIEENGLFPLKYIYGEKKPAEKWKHYLSAVPSEAERKRKIEELRKEKEKHNLAVFCGSTSGGVVVFDIETKEGCGRLFTKKVLSETLVNESNKGHHVFFRIKDYAPHPTLKKEGVVELRMESSLCLFPPSLHPKGTLYKTVSSTTKIKMLEMNTEEFITWARAQIKEKLNVLLREGESTPPNTQKCEYTAIADLPKDTELMIQNGAKEGLRNSTRYALIKKLHWLGLGEEAISAYILQFNANCVPPAPEDEVLKHVRDTLPDLKKRKQPTQPKQDMPIVSARELASKDFGPRRWVATGIIPKTGLTFLAGKKGVKKTFSALELALCVAEGAPFFGHYPTEQGHVLYMDAEGGEFTLWERLRKLREEIPEGLDISFYPRLHLDKAEGGPLEEYLASHPDCLVIIDALRRVLEVDENDSKAINDVFMPLKRFCDKYGTTFVVIHHLRKGIIGRTNDDASDEMRGSSDLGNLADSVLILEKVKDSPSAMILKHAKNRVGLEGKPCRIELDDDGEGRLAFNYIGEWEESVIQVEKAGKALLEWAHLNKVKEFKTATAKEVLAPQGFTGKTVSRALTALVEGNQLIRVKKGIYTIPTGTLRDYPHGNEDLGTKGQTGQDKGQGEDEDG